MKKLYQAFKTSQVSVGTTATILAAEAAGRDEVTIQQLGSTPVYIGGADVTTANGFPLPGVAGASITIPATTAIYGRVAAGTQSVAVLVTG